MKLKNVFWAALPLVLVVGCATSNRGSGGAYDSMGDGNLQPTSNREQTRVYSDTATSKAAAASSPEDAKLGEEVRQLFMQDKKLAPPPSNLTATVHNGVVTLRGTIATRLNEEGLRDRIAQLPGVTRVDDQLQTR